MAIALAFALRPLPAMAQQQQQAVPGDRWMEIDLYWFDQDNIQPSVDEFWHRFAPLYAGVQGDRGVILNVGWTVQYIMGWSGDLNDRIVLPTGSGEEPWVVENEPLSGDWQQQQKEWKDRFAHPINVQRHGYQPWTYGDLKKLIIALRETGARNGVRDFKVGSLTYGWPHAYGEVPTWVKRHSEAYVDIEMPNDEGVFHPGRILDPGALLHADSSRMGGLPKGIPEGMPMHQAFAAQWGSLSKAVGLDAIMLRDSIGMPVPYYRSGPYGLVAPSHDAAKRYNANVSALVRETKLSNPAALVMMYSNGASAVADWRSNCFDLESIAKEGYLDVFVDQTWAGAWNEVGVRSASFWNSPTQGWTYQLAYMLMHSAMLSGTKVRHYPLIETFDAWESWDVLHTVPDRLRWGIWAYSHAGVKTPEGLKMPVGSYISWANQGTRLLSDEDVHFLATNIDAAVVDAHQTTEVYGPTLVYSREAMQWQMDHASPDNDMKEWMDEQAGSVMKWPLPILSVTRAEWLPRVKSDLFVLQTPVHLSAAHLQAVTQMIRSGQPTAIFGSPVSGVDASIENLTGFKGVRAAEAADTKHAATTSADGEAVAKNVPQQFQTRTRMDINQAVAPAKALYSVEGSPALSMNTAAGRETVSWDPPTFHDATAKPLLELWGGSTASYALAAGALNTLISTPKYAHATQIDLQQNISVAAWRTADGKYHVLAGELEEGLRNDANRMRQVEFALPAAWKQTELKDSWSGRQFDLHANVVGINLDHAQSVLLTGKP